MYDDYRATEMLRSPILLPSCIGFWQVVPDGFPFCMEHSAWFSLSRFFLMFKVSCFMLLCALLQFPPRGLWRLWI